MSTPFTDDTEEDYNINLNTSLSSRVRNKKDFHKNEVKYFSELKTLEKELVKLAYREGCIKGFTLNQIPQFIEIKTKVKISMGLAFRLKEMQIDEDRFYFYQLARDQHTYVGAYRECIDEIQQLKNELWKIIMHPQTNRDEKISAVKELHNLVKTKVLLIRDLPFITNLSKYYDLSKLEDKGKPLKSLGAVHQRSKHEFLHQLEKETFDNVNTSLVNTILERNKNRKSIPKTGSDPVMENMKAQTTTIEEDLNINTDQKSEDQFLNHTIGRLEAELNEIKPEDNYDKVKVENIKSKYENKLSYLDNIVSPEQRENISRLREMVDSESGI